MEKDKKTYEAPKVTTHGTVEDLTLHSRPGREHLPLWNIPPKNTGSDCGG
jgi:hypothetical protein